MRTFIEPEKIDILCNDSKKNMAQDEKNDEADKIEVNDQQSGWAKIGIKLNTVWRKINPVISGLTMFFTVAATFIKSVTKFCTQCKNLKAVFA